MMKHNYAINVGLAVLLVVPAVSMRGQEPVDLGARLAATLEALEDLAGLQQRLERGDGTAISEVRAVTEAALPISPENDSLLAQLREQVSQLQVVYDELTRPRSAGQRPLPTGDASQVARSGGARPPEISTKGLEPREREALARLGDPRHTTPRQVTSDGRRAFEDDPEYSVDRVEEARLLVRSGKYSDALELLTPALEGLEAKYWAARCLDKLDRRPEAISLLQSILADPEAGAFGKRAKYDLEFLEVRNQLDQRHRSRKERK